MSEFYVVRAATKFEDWVDKDGNWNEIEAQGDPFEKGYHLDYPTKQDALSEAVRLNNAQVLVFSSEKPYPLIDWLPKSR
jgi:hypothetical protein